VLCFFVDKIFFIVYNYIINKYKGDVMKLFNPDYNSTVGSVRDPMVVLFNGTYYLVATTEPYWNGPNPGVKMWSSPDLITWNFEGLMVDSVDISEDAPCKDRFWAPELFIGKNKFFITFNAKNDSENYSAPLKSFVAVSDNITGPYNIIPKPLVDVESTTNDAHLFRDDDGTVWLFCNLEGSIIAQRFDEDSASTYGDYITLIKKGEEGSWDSVGIEGSFVVKRDGKLYLWYSSWSRGYEMGLAVSDGMDKPFVKMPCNPIISCSNPESENDSKEVTNCGHNSCLKLKDGRDVVIYHGNMNGKKESICIEEISYPPVPHRPPAYFEI